MSDAVNPAHYKRLPAEAIEIIEAMIAGAPDNKAAYLHGQAAKYDLRLWEKGESIKDFLSDWQKHIWYALRLERHLIELVEKQTANEQQKASDLQSLKDHPFGKLKQPSWTPKIGDWVRVNAPEKGSYLYSSVLESFSGRVSQVVEASQYRKEYVALRMDGSLYYILIDCLEPAEQPSWTPKIGDWVRIKKPSDTKASAKFWWPEMDKYDGQIIQVKEIVGDRAVRDVWAIVFEWLEPVEPTLNSDKIPQGYRKLEDSSIEPRQLGDLRWSVSEKRYVEIKVDEIEYADRDNWAACRKVETPVVKQSLTPEAPDGWRWLERGEVIRKGDRYFDGDQWKDRNWAIGETYSPIHQKTIRRNRFEVGEKVVDCRTGAVSTVQHTDKQYPIVFLAGVINAVELKHLAPYIEETE